MEKIFSYFAQQQKRLPAEVLFDTGLVIGAGDGYQSSLLAQHIRKLISSDLNPNRLKIRVPGVEYIICDADNLSIEESFDLIFSDSVLEHLSNPEGFLKKSRDILHDSGYAIHIVPTRLMKVSYIVLHFPKLASLVIERMWGLVQGKAFFRGQNISAENNLNVQSDAPRKKYWQRMLLPSIHGNYQTHWEEFSSWGQWSSMFQRNGYQIEARIKGVASSGYGFGFERTRHFLEALGWSSLDIYILKKQEP